MNRNTEVLSDGQVRRVRQEWRDAEREMSRKCDEWRLRGWDIRHILTRSGYTVREFADYLTRNGARITTIRSVYRLMTRDAVTTRYADLLKELVGANHYRIFLKEIILKEERRARERREHYR